MSDPAITRLVAEIQNRVGYALIRHLVMALVKRGVLPADDARDMAWLATGTPRKPDDETDDEGRILWQIAQDLYSTIQRADEERQRTSATPT